MKDNIFEKINNWIKESITLKMFTIGILIGILLIPSYMIQSLIKERRYRRDSAVLEISSKWGNAQIVAGPIMTVPYKSHYKDHNEVVVTSVQYAHFLPDLLEIKGTINPEIRYRGIYEVVLYNTNLIINSSFSFPDFREWNISEENILWQDAFISVGISDMRGVKDNFAIKWDEDIHIPEPGIATNNVFSSGISTKIPLVNKNPDQTSFKCAINMNLNGSHQLSFLPLGKKTTVHLNSAWENPSFMGCFLPEEREINTQGFNAQWKILHLNRNYPQQWLNRSYKVDNSAFGVRLILPVDEYQKIMRTSKYAILFIILTFLSFFIIEILKKLRLHPIQYLLIGAGMILFYSLLLSLSEHTIFGFAYFAASASVILLISTYTKSILHNNMLAGVIGGLLTSLYSFLYIILQLQDYSLLMGSVGLFIVLAMFMYLTRNINWYSVGVRKKEDLDKDDGEKD
ncbi:MAG: cell envelope integrity protein CreD [bacterium]